jgi:MFS transporter, DHA1 family, tetracycline resistance protein
MARRTLQYVTIFLTCFIDILGFGIVIPVLPLYGEHFGATAVQIGWVVGIFSLMQFFFAPIWGRISDRIGRKPVLLIGLAGTVLGYVLMGLAQTVTALFVARLIAGISGANISAAQAYLADISTPETRARAMGLLGAAFGLGFVFGPALGGWAGGTLGYAAPMFIAAGLAALNFCFVLFRLPESRQPGAQSGGRIFPGLFAHVERRVFIWSVTGYFLVIAGFSIMTSLFALLLLHRYGLDATGTGYILAGVGLIGAVIQGGLIGRLVQRFGELALALTGAVLMALGLFGLGLTASFGAMLAAMVAVGIGNSLLMPTLTTITSRRADADWQGRALGVMQSGGSLARWAGPMVAGTLLGLQMQSGQGPYAALPMLAGAGAVVLALGALGMLGAARSARATAST